jgi:hypothetical protein
MSHAPFLTRQLNGGTQQVFRFDNGFGASVVQHRFSYGSDHGKWELAVVKIEGDDWDITYDTDITSDVIGHLEWADVVELLDRIAVLQANGSEAKSAESAKPEVKIHDWKIIGDRLYGLAEGHPELGTQRITSSTIQRVDHEAGIVETRNTAYRLIGKGDAKAAA